MVDVRLKDKPERDGIIELRDILENVGLEKLFERESGFVRGGGVDVCF